MLEILSKRCTLPHLLKVEEGNPSIEALQTPDISMLSAGVFFPVLIEDSSVVRRHVLRQSKQLFWIKLIKLLVQTEQTLLELNVGVYYDELLEGKDEVIEW